MNQPEMREVAVRRYDAGAKNFPDRIILKEDEKFWYVTYTAWLLYSDHPQPYFEVVPKNKAEKRPSAIRAIVPVPETLWPLFYEAKLTQ